MLKWLISQPNRQAMWFQYKKNNLYIRSLLMLVIYLLHFALTQSFVAYFSGSEHSTSFFSHSHKGNMPNSGIATFRMLEKHQSPQHSFKLTPDFFAIYDLFDLSFLHVDRSIDTTLSPARFQLSYTSYRLYLKARVFRI
jgi:hypothetical protein